MTPTPPPGFELIDTPKATVTPTPPPGFVLIGPEEQQTPEQKRDAAMDERVKKERAAAPITTPIDDTIRGLVRGVPILGGFADEIAALVSSKIGSSSYEDALAYERAKDRAFDAEAPVRSTVTKLASGLATSVAAPLPFISGATTAGRVAGGAATGATYGAGQGFAEGEGGVGNRIENAGEYAMGGALLGGALAGGAEAVAAAGRTARTAAPQIAARIPGGDANRIADDVLAARIDRAGLTPQQIIDDLNSGQEAARFGTKSQAQLPEMIADTSDAMQRLTGSVYRQGGQAGERVRAGLETRQTGDPNQMSRFATGDTGQRGQIEDALARAMQISTSDTARRTERELLAKQARDGQKLYSDAFAKQEPFDTGPAMAAFAQARQLYTGPARAALDKASALFEAPMNAVTRTKTNYNNMELKYFDASKKQLDDMIEAAKRGGENNLARELTVFKNNLLSAVHGGDILSPKLNKAYAEARNAWGTAAENREAIDLGRAAFREDSAVSVEQFRDLSDGQKALFRQGFLESVGNYLGGRRPGNDATLPFRTGRMQELLREVIPNTKSKSGAFADRSGQFGEYISRQERMGQTRQRVLGNSATQQRSKDDTEFDGDAFARVMMSLRSGTNVALEVVGAALRRATSYRQDVADALAQRLMESDPSTQQQILSTLQKRMGAAKFQSFSDQVAKAIPAAPAALIPSDQ